MMVGGACLHTKLLRLLRLTTWEASVKYVFRVAWHRRVDPYSSLHSMSRTLWTSSESLLEVSDRREGVVYSSAAAVGLSGLYSSWGSSVDGLLGVWDSPSDG